MIFLLFREHNSNIVHTHKYEYVYAHLNEFLKHRAHGAYIVPKTHFENFLNDLTYTINAAAPRAPKQSASDKKVNYNLEVSITSEFVDNDVIIRSGIQPRRRGVLAAKGVVVLKTTNKQTTVAEKKYKIRIKIKKVIVYVRSVNMEARAYT